ncbi:unnamed protein product [Musa hybrid cultivar]
MSSPRPRSSKPTRLSPFFRDLASPISPHHRPVGRFATPGQAAAVSALWKENLAGSSADPPPPPVFTLDDRADLSPEVGLGELPPPSPVSPTSTRSRTPPPRLNQKGYPSPSPSLSSSSFVLRTRAEVIGSGVANGRGQSPEGSIWMASPKADGGEREMGQGSPVDGVVESGALMVLPPPLSREIARPEPQGYGVQNGGLDADEWVTVFGFSPDHTNLVLREFEKCGVIVKHVPGPSDANWIHILYQNLYDAQKALKKNGMRLNSLLIVGVKPVDPVHRQLLKEKINRSNHGGFMVSLPSKSAALNRSATSNSSGILARSYQPKTNSNVTTGSFNRATGSIATPAKSVVSKVMDLMFGI